MQFLDTDGEWVYDNSGIIDSTRSQGYDSDMNLQEFFARPVVIGDFAWTSSVILFHSFNPWKLFCEQKRVINRLCNFRNARFKLHVKFVINGSPFYFGRAIASYIPLSYIPYDDFTLNRALVWEDNIAASQTPHIYIDPTTCTAGELDLPFLYQYNYIDVVKADWNNLGQITIRHLVPLANTTGNVDDLTITVMAWASEVELSSPTIQNPSSIVPQGSEDPDSVSSIAASVAVAAGALRSVPVIGKYARAAEIVSSTVADKARLMGFSRPGTCRNDTSVVNSFPQICNVNTYDTSTKLTLDHMQGVTIDPSVTGGSSEDEMTVKSIASRESLLTYFVWGTGKRFGDQLYQNRVEPCQYSLYASREIHMTPSCFIAIPFRSWRGSMIFRFTVVCSAFHKGRIRIYYEPSKFAAGTSGQYNVNQSVILDLNQSREVSVRVGWGAPWTYCSNNYPTYSNLPYSTYTDPSVLPPSDDDNRFNGYIGVEVVTPLSNPNPLVANSVYVLVHTKAGDDFEVANPSNTQASYAYRPFPDTPAALALEGPAEQSANDIVLQGSAEEVGPSEDHMEPVSDNTEPLAPAVDDSDPTNLICFGDPVVSIRALLKRYCFHSLVGYAISNLPPASAGAGVFFLREPDFPAHRGIYYDGNNPYVTGTGADISGYYYSNNTLLNYFTPAFVCRRGGTRRTYAVSGYTSNGTTFVTLTSIVGQYFNFSVERRPGADAAAHGFASHAAPFVTSMYQQSRRQSRFVPGGAGNQLERFGVISVEIPYQSPQRFALARRLQTFTFPEKYGGQFHNLTYNRTINSSLQPVYNSYVAGADDYSLSYFLSVPIMYYSTNPLYT